MAPPAEETLRDDAAHLLIIDDDSRIRTLLARYADIPESVITIALDGCNLPVFRLPLQALAVAYARLMAPRLPGEDRAGAAVRTRIVRAMASRPEMVAGAGRFTTDFLRAGRGRWIGKEGAEGVYAVGLAPEGRGGGPDLSRRRGPRTRSATACP
jgi:L-asparaginase II